MALGTCSICKSAVAKYKCPKCAVEYCSLPCFKSPVHSHAIAAAGLEPSEITVVHNTGVTQPPVDHGSELFRSIAADTVIQSLLGYKSLQVHLAVLLRILEDSRITNEPLAENRRDIANMRLCELRTHGKDENELVEEFVQRVLLLVGDEQS